ncbi:MAG: Holliday junction branch migration protein RuvA, partial [Pseudomonadota bacterium]
GTAALYTEMVVREDLLQLFGFSTLGERDWHRLLISVQGVGAKVSLAILGTLGLHGLPRALAAGDAAAVKAAPGVGPKLATRIVTELKGKAPQMMALGSQVSKPAVAVSVPLVQPTDPVSAPTDLGEEQVIDREDAVDAVAAALSALENLGYDRTEAAEAVVEAQANGATGEGDLIKAALRIFGRNL